MATNKPFECSVCNALFVAKKELAAHLKDNPSCKTIPKKRVDATLIAEMEDSMKANKSIPKKSGLETSILSAVADGDDELVKAYKKLTLNPTTGAREINKEIMKSVINKAQTNEKRMVDVVNQAQAISICFLLDTTRSMESYISGVKEQIIEIVERVKASGCGLEGLAFVGYKDWCDGKNHFEILPFTKSVSEFKTFVATVRARGGGDFPEDVLGGLYKAVCLSWPQQSRTRIIYHLGDAPPHGKEMYHPDRDYIDDYKLGHKNDPSLEKLFEEMRSKELMYYFGRINGECDKMISVFETYYGDTIEKMDSTDVATICDSVTASVMRSVSISSRSATPSMTNNLKLRKFVLDEKEPEWSKLERLDGTILTLKLPESIQDITTFLKLEDKLKKCRLQIAPNPFSKGSVRLAFYGKIFYSSFSKDGTSTEVSDEVVFKEIMSLPAVEELDRERYMAGLEVQTIAAKLALEFNAKLSRTSLNPHIKIKFLMAKVVRIKTDEASTMSPRYLAYEKRFRGEKTTMIKYMNNLDFILDPRTLDEEGRKRLELAVAFAHFSHDITDGYLLVCDLQGVSSIDARGNEILLLTDPAIHCSKHLRFGKTSLSNTGINAFFKRHACNYYCQALGLRMPA